jgi:hypothetical protein
MPCPSMLAAPEMAAAAGRIIAVRTIMTSSIVAESRAGLKRGGRGKGNWLSWFDARLPPRPARRPRTAVDHLLSTRILISISAPRFLAARSSWYS